MRLPFRFLLLPLLGAGALRAEDLHQQVARRLDGEYASLERLYEDIHSHPELSLMESRTSARFAEELRQAGLTVTEHVGGFGVVGILRNGAGPTLLIRTELDALPIKEQTGLPFASAVVVQDLSGRTSPVDHACAHDLHLTAVVGTARIMAAMHDQWSGTLVLIGQPAEEVLAGAYAMLSDGLYTRFPRPDLAISLHTHGDAAAGMIAVVRGTACANVDSVNILVRGVGGHGAHPESTKDPIVLASQIVLDLQTIVSREITPGKAAVVTVGTIRGGTKRNIIPAEVNLELTLRSYDEKVSAHLVQAVRRICENQARAAGVPDDLLPVVTVTPERTPALYNDPALALRLNEVFAAWFGRERLIDPEPTMAGEDFAWFGRAEPRIPLCMWFIGAADPVKYAESQRTGVPLPSNHSPFFAPDFEPTYRTSVTSLCAAVLELLPRK